MPRKFTKVSNKQEKITKRFIEISVICIVIAKKGNKRQSINTIKCYTNVGLW